MQLLHLEREEMHAAHHIERCKFPLAPIRQIPNEILSTIFVCYVEITNAPCTDVQRGVWILGRFAAIGGPSCSTLLPFGLSSFRYYSMWEDARNPSALAEEYLRRSGNSPLSIEFRYSPDDGLPQHLGGALVLRLEDTASNVEDASKDVFDALLNRSPQSKAAKFEIPASIYPEMRTVMDNFPNLARFHLDFQFRRDDSSFHDTEILRSCARLVDLTLELSSIPELFTQHIDFLWHQLTRYSGTASYGPLSVLTHAPNIVNCDLHYQSDPHLGSRLIHRMRSLRLRYGALGFDLSSDFLNDLELPALERLALSCDNTGSVASLLHRSAPPLESLEFRFQDPRPSTSRLVDVLTTAPALTRLVIWNGAHDDMRDASEVFRPLIYSPGLLVPFLLPRLKYLEVSGFELDASFVRIVESRCVRGRAVSGIRVPESDVDPLESLSVTELPVDTDPALLFRLREIEMRCGMKSTIRLQNSNAQTRPFIRISNA